MRVRWLAGVLAMMASGASVSVVAASAAAGSTRVATAFAGRFYDASGAGGMAFQIKVSASGRQVTASAAEGYQFVCGAGSTHSQKGSEPNPDAPARTANIAKDGTFKLSLPVSGDKPIKLTATIVTRTKISGVLTWRAAGEGDRGCVAQTHWSASLRPLNNYFAGETSTGAAVTFEVTDDASPVMSDFSVGGVAAVCTGDAGSTTTTTAATTTTTQTGTTQTTPPEISISDGYVGQVKGGSFSVMGEDSNGIEFRTRGTLTGHSASGVVSEFDRTGCAYGKTDWAASFVRRGL